MFFFYYKPKATTFWGLVIEAVVLCVFIFIFMWVLFALREIPTVIRDWRRKRAIGREERRCAKIRKAMKKALRSPR